MWIHGNFAGGITPRIVLGLVVLRSIGAKRQIAQESFPKTHREGGAGRSNCTDIRVTGMIVGTRNVQALDFGVHTRQSGYLISAPANTIFL